ncbi:MAG TPA: DUF222 domain-containing protein [Frankiaceae bacterium]|jgi:hypothetical protein|nr:DUF222 domain-containing protein [Frankiaceae bacterium]
MFDMDVESEAAQIHALAARLAACIDGEVEGAAADQALDEVLAASRQLDLLTCRLVERSDRTGFFQADGACSASAYMRLKSNERHGWASKRVLVGRAIADRLPFTAKVWESGGLGLDHAAVIDEASRWLDDDFLAAELDRILAEAAAGGATPRDLEVLADRTKADHAPAEAAAKARQRHRDQKVKASKTFDGMTRVDGWLDPEAGDLFGATLDFFTPAGASAEQVLADPSCFESIALRRALALVQMCRHAMAHATGCNGELAGREAIVVGIDYESLKSAVGMGSTSSAAGGSPLPAAAIRRMACDADVIPAVLGSESQVLDLGRRSRLASPSQRMAVVLRDGGCVFAGCDLPPSFCQVHHRDHWIDGGCTDQCNLDLLCLRHHHLCHEGGWRMSIGPDAQRTPYFHPPRGGRPLKGQRRPMIPSPRRT